MGVKILSDRSSHFFICVKIKKSHIRAAARKINSFNAETGDESINEADPDTKTQYFSVPSTLLTLLLQLPSCAGLQQSADLIPATGRRVNMCVCL